MQVATDRVRELQRLKSVELEVSLPAWDKWIPVKVAEREAVAKAV